MKRWLLWLLLTASAAAQSGNTVRPLIASDFGHWTVPAITQVPSAGIAGVSLMFSSATASSGPTFVPVSLNTPLLIIDTGNNEVVTPTGVSCPVGGISCTFTATFAKAHPGGFQITSGTFGLQEAINYVLGGANGTIQITQDWPGTTAMITSAKGGSNVGIQDIRSGLTLYSWNGASYVPGSQCFVCSANGFTLGTGQYGAVSITNDPTGTITNGLVSISSAGLAIATPAGSVTGPIGVCTAGCGTVGFANIVQIGQASLQLDNPGTAGDFVCVTASGGTNGFGTDCGVNPTQVQVGYILGPPSCTTCTVLLNLGGQAPATLQANALITNPGTAQHLKPGAPNVNGLDVDCGNGAGAQQVCFSVSDDAGNNLVSFRKNGTVTFSGGGNQGGGQLQSSSFDGNLLVVTYSSTPVFDLNLADGFTITLTGPVTSSTVTNFPAGPNHRLIHFEICQDGSGNHPFAWPTSVTGVAQINGVGYTPNSCTEQMFETNGTALKAISAGIVQ